MPFAWLALVVFLAGALSVLSPCILPVLPFVFGGTGQPFARRAGPMLLGLASAFVVVALAGTAAAAWAAAAADAGRWAALALLATAGIGLLSTRAAAWSMRPFVTLGNYLEHRLGRQHGPPRDAAVARAATLGVATGLLWSPCAGPALGLVAALASSGASAGRAALLFACFGVGAAAALAVVLAAGGRAIHATRRFASVEIWLRRLAGGASLGMVAVLALGWDAPLLSHAGLVRTAAAEELLLGRLAPDASGVVARMARAADRPPPPPDLGPLPDLGGAGWLNDGAVRPLLTGTTLPASALRGKVVVVNVWTFACYNCLNALPHVQALAAKYAGQDVVVIGVHTPELARERVPANVADAVRRLHVTYPVVLDPSYRIWRALENRYWPSVYIADKAGRIRFHHFGEGAYAEEDRLVEQLLAEAAPSR
jgi:cytochrome c biogenesis protein CcdA/thiol-disulfide isomerase/thioredoxin